MEENTHSAPETSRQVATSRDLSEPIATSDDYISIKEVRDIFLSKDRKITERTLQRYCEKHYLDGVKRITAEGEKWFVLRSSVLTRITELNEFDKLRPAATTNDTSTLVAELNQDEILHDRQRQQENKKTSEPVVSLQPSRTTIDDQSRQDATGRDVSEGRETLQRSDNDGMTKREMELYDKYILQLEIENKGLKEDKEKLYGLLEAGNVEKRLLIESDRDSKAIAKNTNSSFLWLTKFFNNKGMIEGAVRDVSHREEGLTDALPGDERGM